MLRNELHIMGPLHPCYGTGCVLESGYGDGEKKNYVPSNNKTFVAST
jgi:hypothetical protein